MTRPISLLTSGFAAAVFLAGTASKSFAVEPGDFTNYLRGASQGLPLGALPPPGIYGSFGLDVTGLPPGHAGVGNQAIPGAAIAPAFGYGATVLFVPGWTFLGASYGAAVVQGFYFGTSDASLTPPFAGSGTTDPELANTSFTPIDLSWNLGHGWFFSAAMNIVGPDGSQWPSTGAPGFAVNLNPDYWTFAPGWAVSYLDANWMASANFQYDINTASAGHNMGLGGTPFGTGYVSGNELFGDLTLLYKVGKWSFGPVGYFEAQTTADTAGGGGCAALATSGLGACAYQSQVAVGALVGYDFGPVAVQAWFDDTVECKNAVCGLDVWGRMSFKIWGFDTPKPLVAKN
jgi:hypothetical protein